MARPVKKSNSFKPKKAPLPGKGTALPKEAKPAMPWLKYLLPLIIGIITFMCFRPALDNQFINTWDDGVYVLRNRIITELNSANLREIFSFDKPLQTLTKNYHPLTTLSLAVNYHFSKLEPRSYFLTNILIHCLNAILVFIFIYLISKKKIWAAALAGLWFGIHPMHVESVAWISERKDVLYAFFFLCGLISYHFYLVRKTEWKYLALSLLFFVLSTLSKAMAVPFPLVMILMDIFYQRKLNLRTWIEKIPFLAVSAGFGMLAIHIQSTGAIGSLEIFNVYQRIMHGSYGFLMYLYKLFLPVNLSAFYPYPYINASHELPLIFRIAPFIFFPILGISAWLLFLKGPLQRSIGFGMIFFFLTIVLVLQFISVGMVVMADRYAYLPYIGIFFILGEFLYFLFRNKNAALRSSGYAFATVLLIYTIYFITLTQSRIKVWKDDISLWTDALDQAPDSRLNNIRDKRARTYLDKGEYRKSFEDFAMILESDPKNVSALEFSGRICGRYMNDMNKCMQYLNRAYTLDPKNTEVLISLGVAYSVQGDIRKGLDFSLRALPAAPNDTILISNIASAYKNLGDMKKGLEYDEMVRKLRK